MRTPNHPPRMIWGFSFPFKMKIVKLRARLNGKAQTEVTEINKSIS